MSASLPWPVLLQGVSFGLIATLIWSGHSSVSALAIKSGLTSLDLTALRVLVAGVVLFPIFWINRRTVFAKLGVGRALLLACSAGALFSLVNIAGLAYAPATHSGAISLGSVPVFAIFISAVLMRTPLGWSRLLPAILILLGILGVVFSLDDGLYTKAWLGDLCFAAGGALWACYSVLSRKWDVAPLLGAAIVSVLSLPYLLIYLPLYGHRLLQAQWSTLALQGLYQGGFVGIMAIVCYSASISRLGVQKGVMFTAMAPFLVAIYATLILDYQASPLELVGLGCVALGILAALRIPNG